MDAEGGTTWILGNGGSQANASHLVLHLCHHEYIAHDLMAEISLMSALSNDKDYGKAPALRLRVNATDRDCLLVISGSGDSLNIIAALSEAHNLGMTTIGLLGMGGGPARGLCHHYLVVDSGNYGVVEDTHSAVIHLLGLLFCE